MINITTFALLISAMNHGKLFPVPGSCPPLNKAVLYPQKLTHPRTSPPVLQIEFSPDWHRHQLRVNQKPSKNAGTHATWNFHHLSLRGCQNQSMARRPAETFRSNHRTIELTSFFTCHCVYTSASQFSGSASLPPSHPLHPKNPTRRRNPTYLFDFQSVLIDDRVSSRFA